MKKGGRARRPNPVARALRKPALRPRVVKAKKAYSSKAKHAACDADSQDGPDDGKGGPSNSATK